MTRQQVAMTERRKHDRLVKQLRHDAAIAGLVAEARRVGVDALGWLRSDRLRAALLRHAARQPRPHLRPGLRRA
jgi:hypothetical protein